MMESEISCWVLISHENKRNKLLLKSFFFFFAAVVDSQDNSLVAWLPHKNKQLSWRLKQQRHFVLFGSDKSLEVEEGEKNI